MGFLNHATNNIIIDAVLTERGRQLLSEGNGQFVITQFAFGDDEVDYTNITKYGKIIGKEKIEKNTPIFEANTNENIALKNKLISLSNSQTRIFFMPQLSITSNSTSISPGTPIDLFRDTTNNLHTALITVSTSLSSTDPSASIVADVKDNIFSIKVNNDLLKIRNNTPINIDRNKIATYNITASRSTNDLLAAKNIVEATFEVSFSPINDNVFNVYGRASNQEIIDTPVQIVGNKSSASSIVNFRLNLNQSA